MISIGDVYKGLKAAAGLFGQIGDAERAAARKQSQLLDHLSDDLLAIRVSLTSNSRIDPFAYAKFKLAARACKDGVPELLSEINDVEALVDTNYKSAGRANAPLSQASDQIGEFAGAFKATARTLLTLAEPNK